MLRALLRNWKTNIAGAITIVTGVFGLLGLTSIGAEAAASLIVVGFGLLSAKDSDTHSTETEVIKATVAEIKDEVKP